MSRRAARAATIETPMGLRFGAIAVECYVSRARIVELVALAAADDAFDHTAWSVHDAKVLELLAARIRDGYAKEEGR